MRILKRFFDFIFALIALVIISPFFIVLMILVKLTSKGPIFYKHLRVGKFNKRFYLLKFRTMNVSNKALSEIFTPSQMEEYKIYSKVKNDPRITRFGKFLRRSSLDELPQLFNILKGQMSFVGPRPMTLEEIEKIDLEDRGLFLKYVPGLTGYWAVNGRSSVSFKKRIELEMFYVNNWSLWLDIKIFFKTFFVFFRNSE